MKHFEGYVGVNFLTRTEGELAGAAPFPGSGALETMENNWYFFPDGYLVLPLTNELNVGVGGFAQYGLGLKWDNPNTTFTGQFISQNSVIQSLDTNLNFSYRLFPQLSIAAGVDYRFSKVQLERNQAAINPFNGRGRAGRARQAQQRAALQRRLGLERGPHVQARPRASRSAPRTARRSTSITRARRRSPRRPTGNAALDAIVAASLPPGNPPVRTSIAFPSSLNLGVGIELGNQWLLSLEADWTEWSRLQSLAIIFPTLPGRDIFRPELWQDSWAYRAGLEKGFGDWAVRIGYYYDNTPQPDFDVSPLLPDSDRNVYTAGFGYNTERWGFDLAALLLKFKERAILPPMPQTDNYFGTYKETGLVLTAGIRLAL